MGLSLRRRAGGFSYFIASGLTPSNIAIVASSWFPPPSQAFFLNAIEESYNTNPLLILYSKKSSFRSIILSKKKNWLGHWGVWAIAPWIRVQYINFFSISSYRDVLESSYPLEHVLISRLISRTYFLSCTSNCAKIIDTLFRLQPLKLSRKAGHYSYPLIC